MQFIGLRHGQSAYNLLGLCNDDPAREVALTPLGERQARQAGEVLRDAQLTAVYCSPLLRAHQTAQIVNQSLQLPLRVVPALADIRSGYDGLAVADYLAAIAHDPVNARVNGGESLADYAQRVSAFLDQLSRTDVDRVLLVAHEETLRIFEAWAECSALDAVVGKAFANCQPYRFTRP